MPAAAPRLHPRIVEALTTRARGDASAAEIRRALVTLSLELDLPPPSYEHVRRLVTVERLRRELELQSSSEILAVAVDVAVGMEHGNELVRVARDGRRRRR